tara:strand:+ start:277 stop:561 length:285 start_codon:yes stop_codon:yes gene_type:complete
MGRFVKAAEGGNALVKEYYESASTSDAEGYLTSYTANEVDYTNITYVTQSGAAASYGYTYKNVASWVETSGSTSQNVAVNYDATSGRVTSLTIT